MRRIAVIFLFFVSMQIVNANADNPPRDIKTVLGDLEKTMSGTRTISTDFIQEKNLALFNQKIILKGRIFIQKPGLLSWMVLSPVRYSMVIKGSTMSQWDEDTNQVQQVSLAENPSFKVAIVQMQNWFCGTFKAMLNEYTITLTDEHPLTLEFVPLENSVSRNFIRRVTVLFQNDVRYIKEVRIEEKNGDSTSLAFVNTQLNLPIPLSAWEVRADAR